MFQDVIILIADICVVLTICVVLNLVFSELKGRIEASGSQKSSEYFLYLCCHMQPQ